MDNILQIAINKVQNSVISFCKFITANDTGATGGHQAGFHIHKNAWPLFFSTAGKKGETKEKFVTIKWQNDFETLSRFIYYGVGTRNEYRLTRFGKGFPFLHDESTGSLLILCQISGNYYEGFVLETDDDIEGFLSGVDMFITEVNGIIPRSGQKGAEEKLGICFMRFIDTLTSDFPSTIDLATNARNCYLSVNSVTEDIIKKRPDNELLNWLDAEFQLFKMIENIRYAEIIKMPFSSIKQLVEVANTILNRRKSRAGKSLEHQLAEMFSNFHISFEAQVTTEDKKKPDFLFPGAEAYHNRDFSNEKLIVLAAKTTCKDRWRQILNEADRIKTKHLFTLQQGISSSQLKEMYQSNVQLVVPKPYLGNFPTEFRDRIITLDSFLKMVIAKQS